MVRVLAWFMATVAIALAFAAAPARAISPRQQVPVAVQSVPVPQDVPPISEDLGGGIPTASPVSIPTPEPTPMPTIDPSTFKVPVSIFEPLLNGLLKTITDQITPFLNKVTQLGWWIYTLVACISIAINVLQSVILGGEFAWPSVLRYLYWRIVEWGIWGLIIRYTWSGIGPHNIGWFSAIISMFAEVASKVVGIDTSFNATGGWNLDILPGKIADLGVGLFSAIMSMVSIGKGGLWDVLGRSLDGTVLISVALWFFGLFSGLFAMFVCGAIAFKYLWTVVKVYVLGCLSFIQGLGGSRRLGGIAGSYVNSSIVLGAEIAMTIILVGLMWHVIVGLTQALGFGDALALIGSAGAGPVGIPIAHLADIAYTAASLAVLDLALTLWAYAMWRVPRDVAELLSGRIQVSAGEITQAFQSSPFALARAAGGGLNVIQQGGTKGAGAALSATVAPIGRALGKVGDLVGLGAVAGSGNGEGAGGVAGGVVKGFLLGGPEGALAGAIGSIVMSKAKRKEDDGGSYSEAQKEDAEQQHDERSNPDVRDAEATDGISDARQEATVDTSAAGSGGRRNTIVDDVTEGGGSDDPGSDDAGDLPTRHRTRRTQVDEELVTAMRAMTAALNANTASGNQQNVAAAAAGGSRSATRTAAGFDPLSEMDANISIGRMITQRALYRQMRPPRPEPPHRDNESAGLNIPITFGK